jgi:ABC-type transporter MlaC component
MKTNKRSKEIFLGMGPNLNIETAELVTVYDTVALHTLNNDFIQLNVKIQADLSEVPEKYHEVFLNILSAKYVGKVSFGENPFSQCVPEPKKKWWQFWKANLNI